MLKITSIKHLTSNAVKHNLQGKKTCPKYYSSGGFPESEYLEKSSVPTYHFQKSLPRLPVPKLEKTCERYLASQKPLLSADDYSRTESLVKNFQETDGQVLQEELVATDKKNKHTNYVSDVWFDMYLKDRRPVVITHNPFMVFNDDPRREYNNQLLRATNMVVSSVKFMKTLRDEYLSPEVFHLNPAKSDNESFRRLVRMLPEALSWYGAYWYKAFPLDMSQYKRLFCSTRIPRHKKDELYTDPSAKHLVVLRNGNLYLFDVLDRDGNIVAVEDIMAHIKYILEDKTPSPEYPVSILTSENRDVWATVREQLVNAGNENTLKLVDGAVFALVLDDAQPTDPNQVSRAFLHGNGINRWFEKSFMLILNKAGTAAVNFEHAWGDGVAVLRYFKEVFKDTTEKPSANPDTRPSSIDSSKSVQRLEFNLDRNIETKITEAKQKFDAKINSLDFHHLEYQKYTRQFIKKQKLSPDSVLQLAIQMAFYRMYGKTVGTYESCSTSAYKHGRTETIRPCTLATLKMCELVYNKNTTASVEELQATIKECSTVHSELTKNAAMGHGFDRHLFTLKRLAEAQGKNLDIFADPSYNYINHIILSTSTLSDPSVLIGGFAPVVPDGLGIGYSVEDNRLGFNVTSFPPARDVHGFIESCQVALDDIYSILQGQKPSNKS
ncbi:carnitine O-palmitoyltransferase 2, mitochondrial [Patella vulgata]|uniref:carnitine O-palmitoyltransferase 2, mitochondrial n=1 Tax=Patella vulgata TaxID=6465 RepID=UPI002180553E|nr:carnitine O-palmitoyltransferase 2, mitochondrial [Patella vulgata]